MLWAARTAEEPDRDGPLLRALFALLVNLLSVVPSPVWAIVMYIAWVVWVPVRAVLWLWGIGRGESVKKRECSRHDVARAQPVGSGVLVVFVLVELVC